MTVAVVPSRFADELRHCRQLRRWSQLELAVRAGTTQRHLSFIERGRSRPGRAIVLRLAESLALTLRERNRLLLAAGYAPVFPESGLDDPDLRPVHEALDRILDGHLPYPAVITRPYGEMVAANRALDVITHGAAAALLEPPVNVLRLALHTDGMARRVLNLAQWGRHIIDCLSALTSFSTATDVTLAELHLEAFLPADHTTATILQRRTATWAGDSAIFA